MLLIEELLLNAITNLEIRFIKTQEVWLTTVMKEKDSFYYLYRQILKEFFIQNTVYPPGLPWKLPLKVGVHDLRKRN